MKRLAFAAVLFAATHSVALHAQTMKLSADIPFTFQVGKMRLPAGAYDVQNINGVLVVREQHGKYAASAFFVRQEARGPAPKTGLLEFNHYGDSYFLAQVWSPASGQGLSLPPTAREKELVRVQGLIEHTAIALQRK
jgi:hypothetical protein